jgi:hypothetical protein
MRPASFTLRDWIHLALLDVLRKRGTRRGCRLAGFRADDGNGIAVLVVLPAETSP